LNKENNIADGEKIIGMTSRPMFVLNEASKIGASIENTSKPMIYLKNINQPVAVSFALLSYINLLYGVDCTIVSLRRQVEVAGGISVLETASEDSKRRFGCDRA
jgi:hypothetical protein